MSAPSDNPETRADKFRDLAGLGAAAAALAVIAVVMAKREPTPEEREAQLRAFQDAARELGCDDDPDRFDERVRTLAVMRKPSDRGDTEGVS